MRRHRPASAPLPNRPLLHPLAAAVLGLVSLGALPATIPAALAQPAPATAYAIPAGPLSQALYQFAASAGITLSFDPTLTEGLRSPGLNGAATVQQGLDTLLGGSGLQAVRGDNGGYHLRKLQTLGQPGAEGERALREVQVTANQLGEITEGSGSYTPGTIATATRLVLTPRETPQSISVITRQEMNDFALNSIDDVIRHTPGVSLVTYDSERTVYFSRGFAINNFQYDGIPMRRNSAYSAGNTLSDMAVYDRIEVLKGATGLLTGSGDPGATINLIRKKPTGQFQGQLSLSAGSWDSSRAMADLGGPLNQSGSLRGRVVAAYQDKGTELDHYRRRTPVFYGVLEADLTPDTLFTLGVDYQDNIPKGSTWGGIPLFNSQGDFNDTSRSYNPGARWSNWEQYTRTAFATLERYFANGWTAKLQLNHQINGYDAQLGSIGSGAPDPADGSGTSLWLGQYVGKTVSDAADVYASGPFQLFGREHELVLGASAAKRRWTNKAYWPGGYDGTVADFYGWNGHVAEPDWDASSWKGENDETTRESGLYAALRLNPADALKFILGSRVANYRDEYVKERGVVVPYAGVIYDLDPRLSVYASYTTIFNPQSNKDESGRNLAPEEGKSYEIGLKGALDGGRLNATLAYFRVKQDNYAEESGGLTPSGDTAYRAVQGVITRGVEATLSGELAPRWQVQAGYTHRVSRLDGEKVSTEDPEDQFSLFTSYRFSGGLEKLTLGGGGRWQSKSWATVYNPVYGSVKHTLDARWLVDAMARWQFDQQLSLTLNINNLLDKKYYTMMSMYNTYSWGERRNAMLTLDYRF